MAIVWWWWVVVVQGMSEHQLHVCSLLGDTQVTLADPWLKTLVKESPPPQASSPLLTDKAWAINLLSGKWNFCIDEAIIRSPSVRHRRGTLKTLAIHFMDWGPHWGKLIWPHKWDWFSELEKKREGGRAGVFREKPGVVIHWRRNVNCGFKHRENREFSKNSRQTKKKKKKAFSMGKVPDSCRVIN